MAAHPLQHKNVQVAQKKDDARKQGIHLVDNSPQTLQRKINTTGLPDNLKSGIETLSGHSMDDVKVHYNSSQPAQLQAHAYAQGTNIHLAPGQEKHLPHEAWHVVQQKQGRVRPTLQMKGKVNINDDASLEKEADVMGRKALQKNNLQFKTKDKGIVHFQSGPVAQRFGLTSFIPGAAVGGLVGGFVGSLAKNHLGTIGGAVVGGISGAITGGLTGGVTGAISGGISGGLMGSAGGISNSVNTVKKHVPYATEAASIAAASSIAYFTVTSLPITLPVVIHYVAGGVSYAVTEHITGTTIDIISHGGKFPTVGSAAKGLLTSALTGDSVGLPSAAFHMLNPGMGAIASMGATYLYGLPGLMKGRHETLKGRVGDKGMPHQPSETALAFGMDNKDLNLDYKNWAREHGAVTYRYFLTIHNNNWTSTLEQITKKADKIYINIGGYKITGLETNYNKPSILQIRDNIDYYLHEMPGHKPGQKIPAHGFTNFEIAFIIKHIHELENKLVWWDRGRSVESPLLSSV
jgi:hypothetical protein